MEKNKKQLIRKHNDLIAARYNLSLAEMKLLYHVLAMIKKSDTEFFGYYKIDFNDFVEDNKRGVQGYYYKRAKEITGSIRERPVDIKIRVVEKEMFSKFKVDVDELWPSLLDKEYITVFEDNNCYILPKIYAPKGKIIFKNDFKGLASGDILENIYEFLLKIKPNGLMQTNWGNAYYKDGKGYVIFELNNKLRPYLLDLKARFKTFELRYLLRLQSVYSQRIYELLKQFQLLKKRTFEVDELKKILGVEHTYPLYKNFKQRVLNQAERELKKYSDIYFTLKEERRYSRKITQITFNIHINEQVLIENKEEDRIIEMENDNISFSQNVERCYNYINGLPEDEKEALEEKIENFPFGPTYQHRLVAVVTQHIDEQQKQLDLGV